MLTKLANIKEFRVTQFHDDVVFANPKNKTLVCHRHSTVNDRLQSPLLNCQTCSSRWEVEIGVDHWLSMPHQSMLSNALYSSTDF